jgi:hypothetical protein
LTLPAEEAQAAEGVAVQPDGCAQVRQGVAVVGQGLLDEGHLGEADHRMGPLALRPGQAEFSMRPAVPVYWRCTPTDWLAL